MQTEISVSNTFLRETHSDSGLPVLLTVTEPNATPSPLPLTSVSVRAKITGEYASTSVTQTFRNSLPATALEATYIFPLPPDAAVVELELRAGDKVVKGEIHERADAEKMYNEARESGHTAAMLTAERKDVHTVRLANLPPNVDVSARVELLQILPSADGKLQWRFPTVVAPRYMPGTPIGRSGDGATDDTTLVPDASHISPPIRSEGGTLLDMEVEIFGKVAQLESSLHAIRVNMDDDRVVVRPSGRATLDRDFILALSCAESTANSAVAYANGGYLLVSVVPPQEDSVEAALPRDVVFVIDRSGSMSGSKIEAARLALRTALHALRSVDQFKIIAFDHSMMSFRSDFAPCTDENVRQADEWIAKIEARGGTQMLAPIVDSLSGDTVNGRIRTVLFITDGQAGNDAQLQAAVANRRKNAVFFTLGIDTAVNESLLKSLANVGGGTCELCTPQDDIEEVILRLDGRLGTALLQNVSLSSSAVSEVSPPELNVFGGRPVSLLAKYTGTLGTVMATGISGSGAWESNIEVRPTSMDLSRLWAKATIAALEERILVKPFEDEALRPAIVTLSMEHKIVSKFTSFVAVDKSTRLLAQRVTVVQPVESPHAWAMPQAMCSAVPQQMFGASMSASIAREGAPKPPPPVGGPQKTRVLMARHAKRMPRMPRESHAAARERVVLDEDDCEEQLSPFNVEGENQKRDVGTRQGTPPSARSIAGELSRSQAVNGSIGASPDHTAMALVCLVLLGNTRNRGIYKRTVQKICAFLRTTDATSAVITAFDCLDMAEREASSLLENAQKLLDRSQDTDSREYSLLASTIANCRIGEGKKA
eukprot:CAMPEP_0198334250 /NCGR_PEP_ID=MMETSP1450-20131203/19491_1 /TAXON_ID=753684 ORGANISM="Madagascaria erythrocladiodes, Strain CCMP3234" /NCGR_SAMPLE_ID=MMETSP1450 /ASSEMBLY_ACC=CAM_ASM_001115 /LENGTH=825 /DNA_ID=CAMNT_0044038831 /DNA_START=79 /DNA_END=2556 /DNA_ORIENTATION=-